MSILTSSEGPVRAESAASKQANLPWQQELRAAVRDADTLCRRLELPQELAEAGAGGAADFPVFVPPAYLARIRPGDPNDPLLRQVLPLAGEDDATPDFVTDPVGDMAAQLETGVLKKYAGRALLVTTGACAVHCRYCFRRHFPYQEVPHSEAAWDRALQTIADDSIIQEVILSGGDPLMLVDERLARLAEKIAAIGHVRLLRVHTRLPIMIPARVTNDLIAWLTESRLKPVMVVHANHAQELDDEVAGATERLRAAGVVLLNQAVLLRGVNNRVEALMELSHRLVDINVVPYYLHQLDRVVGAAHFEVPVEEGKRLMHELRSQLPGYMVPRYVQELPGEASKTIVC